MSKLYLGTSHCFLFRRINLHLLVIYLISEVCSFSVESSEDERETGGQTVLKKGAKKVIYSTKGNESMSCLLITVHHNYEDDEKNYITVIII